MLKIIKQNSGVLGFWGFGVERPGCVASWSNGLDPRDAVTLGRALTARAPLPSENIADINNGDDPHSIEHYLADRRVSGNRRHLDAPS